MSPDNIYLIWENRFSNKASARDGTKSSLSIFDFLRRHRAEAVGCHGYAYLRVFIKVGYKK